MKLAKQIPARAYRASVGFIRRYQELVRDEVIPYQYEVLCDRVEGVEKSYVARNFINAGKVLRGEAAGEGFGGMVFQDSDAAKWLEAVAFTLINFPDQDLEEKADWLIGLIGEAQDVDGYLNTYYTIENREKRWTNLQEGHELYCSGHMIEAAVAYYEATGKRALLDIMRRNMEHIYRHFITEGNPGCPGHPEIELALLKLYRATGDRHALELARYFIDQRGQDPQFFAKEAATRGWTVWGADPTDVEYAQMYAPVREQTDAVGHSVRAVYLYTAMADLASETEDPALRAACRRLWESITRRRMYVTGGIGSTVIGEAFTVDYDLPNDTVYAETCASIGLMFFASRMLEMEADGEYADVMERAFYNTVLAGMQLDGKRFFYVNPLEVVPGISGVAVTHRHDLPQRPGWYACACCPPNVARTLASIGRYAYAEGEDTAYCHLYAAGTVTFRDGFSLSCETEYPRKLQVTYRILGGTGRLAVRVPGWSQTARFLKNGLACDPQVIKGYAYFDGLVEGDVLELALDEEARLVYASTRVAADTGRAAIQRGPLVYCLEGVDNDGDVLSLSLSPDAKFSVTETDPALPEDVVTLLADGYRTEQTEELYTTRRPVDAPCSLRAVPYYVWGNRGENQMRVWIPVR